MHGTYMRSRCAASVTMIMWVGWMLYPLGAQRAVSQSCLSSSRSIGSGLKLRMERRERTRRSKSSARSVCSMQQRRLIGISDQAEIVMKRVLALVLALAVIMPLGRVRAQEAGVQARLAAAIRMGDAEAVKKAMTDGADPDADAGPMGTAIALAVWYGDLAVVRAMVDAGADLKKAAFGEWTPLSSV